MDALEHFIYYFFSLTKPSMLPSSPLETFLLTGTSVEKADVSANFFKNK